jgi:hypothetical protein
MVMGELSRSPQGRHYPPRPGHRRQERCETAARLLSDYADAVSVAVRALGFAVRAIQRAPGPDLEMRLGVGRGPDPALEGGASQVPDQVELAWAEDTGWSVTYPGWDTVPGLTRYLHLDLAPSPDAVAQFLAAVLLDGDNVGMPYPASFRLRSQPLRPVLDALAHHTTHPDRPLPPVMDCATTATPTAPSHTPVSAPAPSTTHAVA